MSLKRLADHSNEEVKVSLDTNSAIVLLERLDGRKECFLMRAPTVKECQKLISIQQVKTARFVGCSMCLKMLKEQNMPWGEFKREVITSGETTAIYRPVDGVVRIKKNRPVESVDTVEGPIVKKKVLIVDDSKTIQKLLTKIINTSSMLEVVGVADRPSAAREFIEKEKPDLVTLDIHMPEMNGVEFLKTWLRFQNLPVAVVSSVSVSEGPLVMEALSNGALAYVQKPSLEKVSTIADDILEQLEAIAKKNKSGTQKNTGPIRTGNFQNTEGMIAIGSSTGGTQALQQILTALPSEIPPIVIVQHIPAVFSKALAERLDNLCPFTVKEAEDGDKIERNTVYIAPGGFQMKIVKRGSLKKVVLTDDAPVNRFKPSVDYLFNSISKINQGNVVASILTGMGKDGAKGMLELKKIGHPTLAQDEESCVVFGMPREALKIGAAQEAVPLAEMADKIVKSMNDVSKKTSA
ncbi:MAG: chemotaxis response regulator protein-glutamate methylesterase [Bacteriovoracaceae bacterium]|nr:chemotaxis response regulator protein-glutamate methylesterase [Bacteriovoracaceae bacterium]